MEVEWVERPFVTYAFKSYNDYPDLHLGLPTIRGRCIAYARRLDEGGWEVKLAGPRHLLHRLPNRAKAHEKLKRLVAAQSSV